MNWNSGVLKTCRLPLVSTCAMPRPAMNRTSVATIGWMRKRVISQPLNRPNTPATSTGTTKASADADAEVGQREQLAQEDQRRQRAGDRHQRADRQVDAAGGDHERHADADDDDGADLGQVDVQRLQRGEVGREGEVEEMSSDEGEPTP